MSNYTIESKNEFHRATTELQRVNVRNALMTPEVRLAMVFAVSQMVDAGATKEQLEGAKTYRELLLNLAEQQPKPAIFPEKKLTQG